MRQVILFIDNNEGILDIWGRVLTNEGYEFRPARTPQEARSRLMSGGIDLAVLDVRLENDDDELDISGLLLAMENAFQHIPKIILTAFPPSPEFFRRLQDLSGRDLPAAVTWVAKQEGPEKLLEIIPQVISLWPKLQQIKILAGKISSRLEDDHAAIRSHARSNYRRAGISSTVGFGLIVAGILLALFGVLEIGLVAVAGGIVTEVTGFLFFRRLDAANERMDQYHRELLQTYWLELLLAACEPLPAESQITTTERIIRAATKSWFSPGAAVK